MLSEMRLDDYHVEELIIVANPRDGKTTKPEDGPYGFKELEFDLKRHKESPAFRLRMSIEVAPGKSDSRSRFKRVRIALVGFFSFAEGADEAFVKKLTPLNQLSILYGLARGIIVTATGSMGIGTFLLPSVNFAKYLKVKFQKAQARDSDVAQDKNTPKRKSHEPRK